MKINYLLPNRFKRIGWCIFILVLCFMLLSSFFDCELGFMKFRVFAILEDEIMSTPNLFSMTETNITDEIEAILLIVSSIFIVFSREKIEDEFIAKIRLESLVWAFYVNNVILILAILFVFGFAFFWVMVFNMFTILILFIIKFNWAQYKSKKID